MGFLPHRGWGLNPHPVLPPGSEEWLSFLFSTKLASEDGLSSASSQAFPFGKRENGGDARPNMD